MGEGLLIGVISGLISGGMVALLLARWWRPRVSGWQWIKTPFVPDRQVSGSSAKIGYIYKVRFLLRGRASPEWGALEIVWRCQGEPRRRVFAKWDERAMPLDRHDPDEFRPEQVPETYYQPLIVGRVYDVPILFEDALTSRLDIFSGWWFGRSRGYKEFMFDIDPENTPISLHLVGANELNKRMENVVAADIVRGAVPAEDARASIEQERLLSSLSRGVCGRKPVPSRLDRLRPSRRPGGPR